MKRALALYCLCFVALASIGWTSLGASVAHAAQTENYVPLAPIDVPGSEFTSTGPNSECRAPTCFPRYLRTIYNIGIVLAGLFAVVSIVRGGFELMFTDSILGRMEGKGIILRALGGLLIVYSSYILMNAINPALGRDLDLALQFPRVTIMKDTSTLSVVSIEEIQDQMKRDLDAAQAERARLNQQATKKESLANAETDQAAKAALLKEAAELRAESTLNGDVAYSSGEMDQLRVQILTELWGYDPKHPLRSPASRMAEAEKLLNALERVRTKIAALPNVPEKVTLSSKLDDLNEFMRQQIHYLDKGCGQDGLRIGTLIPCPK